MVLGHAIYLLQLVRCTLSVLWQSFQFVVQHLDTDCTIDVHVDGELRVVAGLIVFLHVDMGATVSTQVMCTVSSLQGYAVLSTNFTLSEVRAAAGVAERWKYKPPRSSPYAGLGFQDVLVVGEPSAFGG